MTDFFKAYLTAALWSSSDEDGDGLDDQDYPIEPHTLARMKGDCQAFLDQGGRALIERAKELHEEGKWSLPSGADCSIEEYAGHDFWLTRAGHGCGFNDGDWPEEIEDWLAKLAKSFGTYYLTLDDGTIYGSPS